MTSTRPLAITYLVVLPSGDYVVNEGVGLSDVFPDSHCVFSGGLQIARRWEFRFEAEDVAKRCSGSVVEAGLGLLAVPKRVRAYSFLPPKPELAPWHANGIPRLPFDGSAILLCGGERIYIDRFEISAGGPPLVVGALGPAALLLGLRDR